MELTSRFFRWEDVPALHALVSEKWRRDGPRATLHIGDLYWRLRPQPGCEPTKDIRLWKDANGRLVGFAWWDPPDGGDVVAHPDAHPKIDGIMVDWLEEEGRRRGCSTYMTGCFVEDEQRHSFLTDRGYERGSDGYSHMIISLESEAVKPQPPAGYTLRGIEGRHEIEKRAAVHRAAWSARRPSALTTEVYERLVSFPGYRQDLDLVAVDSNANFVSCTNAWYDDNIRVGEFEPVGCHPEHRRKGVTRALLLEGLRRLRHLGAQQAVVYTFSKEPGTQKLYESCGFTVVGRDWNYTKQLD